MRPSRLLFSGPLTEPGPTFAVAFAHATRSGLARVLRGTAILLGLGAAGSGCGELSADIDTPTRLVTFRVDGSAFAKGAPANVRAALVWRSRGVPGYLATGDVAVSDLGAGPFPFDVRRPPPEAAFHATVLIASEGNPLRFAQGAVVLYTDGNGDGTITFVGGRAEAIGGDAVVASNRTFMTFWLERPPSEGEARLLADARGQAPTAGLNFQRVTADGALWLRATEVYELGTPATTGFPDRVCSYLFESPVPSSKPTLYDLDRTYPPLDAPGLACAEQGRSFSFQGCVAAGLCSEATAACKVNVRRLSPTEAIPSTWPCTTVQ